MFKENPPGEAFIADVAMMNLGSEGGGGRWMGRERRRLKWLARSAFSILIALTKQGKYLQTITNTVAFVLTDDSVAARGAGPRLRGHLFCHGFPRIRET